MAVGYTLVLGTPSISSWSLRPYVAMRATGAPFEKVFIRLRQPETKDQILKYSPSGKIPALRIADGDQVSAVWDSLAICETLAERHPEAGLWPDDAVARAEARSLAAEMHGGFPDLRDQLGWDFGRSLPLPELRQDTQKQIDRVISAWSSALSRHGKNGGYLFGRLSIADCMYAPVVSRFSTYGLQMPRDVQDYMDRIWALPALREWREFTESGIAAL